MARQAFLLHALTPLHAGTGHAAGIIDLPIARMKATGIPFVPGSSTKGVLRAACPTGGTENDGSNKKLAVFGPDPKDGDASLHAGALVVGDARLLALPVRSFKGTFAWVTSPLLLRLALRDLERTIKDYPIPTLVAGNAHVTSMNCVALVPNPNTNTPAGQNNLVDKLLLEDLDLDVTVVAAGTSVHKWAKLINDAVFSDEQFFTKRFAIVDDETMTFLWETATQLDQRVRINEETRTVATGALWLKESLPPETLLIGLMEADKSRRTKGTTAVDMTAEAVIDFGLHGTAPAPRNEIVLQFGGKASIGRGRCRLLPVTR